MSIKKTIRYITPPFVNDIYRIIRNKLFRSNKPLWHEIRNGLLKGYQIFVPNRFEVFKTMINGSYDAFFWDYLKNDNLESKTILDIGGHIGINSMGFSRLVGEEGKVHVFEPNQFNIVRMKKIFEKNHLKTKNIKIHTCAVSNFNEEIEFEFSSNVDNMDSSGGFIRQSFKPLEDRVYKSAKFVKQKVTGKTLDTIVRDHKIDQISLVKIDVEGAEHFVLKGAKYVLQKFHPLLLIEVHSINAMFYVLEILHSYNYKSEIIQEDSLSRCFIAAR